MTQIEQSHLAHEAEGDPLVVGVVHDVLALAAARALALELLGDVEGGVHPAVGLQRALAHPAPGLQRVQCTVELSTNLRQNSHCPEKAPTRTFSLL